ncbi:MAG TPA: hypothetical protein VN643_04865 [Pyrinomonadaceae bacterium]|nr:hypothetical protein [Pyrinomonadaceae bacterium]
MYCSSCGGAVARALSYCNHCGAKLGGYEDERAVSGEDKYRGLLVSAIVGGMVLGLGVIIGLIAVMQEVAHFHLGLLITFTSLSFFLLFAIETVLITQLLRHSKRAPAGLDERRSLPQPTTKELEGTHARALPDPVPSITEHTTRAFEPVLLKRER